MEFCSKIISIDDNYEKSPKVKAHIWDTSGQERYREISRVHNRGAKCVFLVYDISDRKTFMGIENWWTDVKMYGEKNPTVTLVGNKCDLSDRRQVGVEEAMLYAQSRGFYFMETSAMANENVERAFVDNFRSAFNAEERKLKERF